jgi:uncharacterized protein (DUF2267 family)
MTTALNRYATQGNFFVSQLASELDMPENNAHALRVLKAIFYGIRSRITPASSMHLIHQLPMAVKAIYVDGWDIDRPHMKAFDFDDFIAEVNRSYSKSFHQPISRKAEVEGAVHAVFKVLRKNLTDGEYSEMMTYMPVGLRLHLVDYLMEGQSYFH